MHRLVSCRLLHEMYEFLLARKPRWLRDEPPRGASAPSLYQGTSPYLQCPNGTLHLFVANVILSAVSAKMTAFSPPNHADEPGDFDVWLENELKLCCFEDGVAVLKMPQNLYAPLPAMLPRRLSATYRVNKSRTAFRRGHHIRGRDPPADLIWFQGSKRNRQPTFLITSLTLHRNSFLFRRNVLSQIRLMLAMFPF